MPIFLRTPDFPFTSAFSISMTKRPLLLNQSPSQEATQTRRNKICEVKSQGPASAFVKPSKISRVRWNRLCWLALFYGRRCTLAYRSHMGDSVDQRRPPGLLHPAARPQADIYILPNLGEMSRCPLKYIFQSS